MSFISLIGLLPENKKYNPKKNAARKYNTKFAFQKEPVNLINNAWSASKPKGFKNIAIIRKIVAIFFLFIFIISITTL
jgi:hypothetical protein